MKTEDFHLSLRIVEGRGLDSEGGNTS